MRVIVTHVVSLSSSSSGIGPWKEAHISLDLASLGRGERGEGERGEGERERE